VVRGSAVKIQLLRQVSLPQKNMMRSRNPELLARKAAGSERRWLAHQLRESPSLTHADSHPTFVVVATAVMLLHGRDARAPLPVVALLLALVAGLVCLPSPAVALAIQPQPLQHNDTYTVLFLPLDERFTTRDAFIHLAYTTNFQVMTPPTTILPHHKAPANLTALDAWMEANIGNADAAIISAECVCCPQAFSLLS